MKLCTRCTCHAIALRNPHPGTRITEFRRIDSPRANITNSRLTQQAPYQQPPREDYGQPVPQRPGPEDYDEARPAPYPAPEVATSYPRLFAGTIYERAPSQIQENVLFAVQGELMKRGFFRAVIDGRPGPATTDSILRLQQEEGLPMSGRLDNETLNELRAFPGQRNGPPEEFSRPRPPGWRFYRGFPGPF